jgi:hypothetical protein
VQLYLTSKKKASGTISAICSLNACISMLLMQFAQSILYIFVAFHGQSGKPLGFFSMLGSEQLHFYKEN